jgi:hypothetical protein
VGRVRVRERYRGREGLITGSGVSAVVTMVTVLRDVTLCTFHRQVLAFRTNQRSQAIYPEEVPRILLRNVGAYV